MLCDLVYLLLVVLVFFIIIYRIKRNQREGFTDIDGRIVTALYKKGPDKNCD